MLFSCFHHSINDPRLYYRQAKILLAELPGLDIVFLNNFFRESYGEQFQNKNEDLIVVDLHYSKPEIPQKGTKYSLVNFPFKLFRKARSGVRGIVAFFEKYFCAFRINPDVIQVSDVREILFAILMKLFVGSRIIYDSHEDYFNFFYEFSGKTIEGFIRGIWFGLLEYTFLRFFDTVFCADPFLYAKYSKGKYGINKVYLLRNFANLKMVKEYCEYEPKKVLEIVYIGTINKFRGVIETADYIQRFNKKKHYSLHLKLDFFGPPSPILKKLQQENKIAYHGSLPYPKLMRQIARYDIGLSLLLPIEKYKRNIPMKNFEYMAVGLPVLTSNFGQCKKIIDKSEAGICIDPKSYPEFEEAILKLSDKLVRKKLGEAGRSYCVHKASFEREADSYIAAIRQMVD